MGQELTTNVLRIRRFLGRNTKISDTAIDPSEASELKNINLTDEGLEQRRGSRFLSSNTFQDNTGRPVPLTGLFSGVLNNMPFVVGVGGDTFRVFTSGAWGPNLAGNVRIASNKDHLFTFSTFIDGNNAEVVLASNGVAPPWKWTGTGNAMALANIPGNFRFHLVHKNKLWVSVGDTLSFSGLRNGESFDIVNDLIRFARNSEAITGLAVFADRVMVFQETAIYAVSGSSNRDLFVETIVTGDGCASGFSIQEVESRRYGNILIFLSTEGIIKGFNGSKNLIRLGESDEALFRSMNRARFKQAVSMNVKELNQYWIAFASGSGEENDYIVVYDYYNDTATGEDGRPLSTILSHTGIKANAMAVLTHGGQNIPVTGDYAGRVFQQNYGLLDEGTKAITSRWKSGKLDFGTPAHVKLLTDFHVLTTQSSDTTLHALVRTQRSAGQSQVVIQPAGGVWGRMRWGSGRWSGPVTQYTRLKLSPLSAQGRAIKGRYLQLELKHTAPGERMKIEELLIGATDLGQQPEVIL